MANDQKAIRVLLFDDDKDAATFVDELATDSQARLSFTRVASIRKAVNLVLDDPPDVILASLTSKKNEILSLIIRIRYINTEIPIVTIGATGCEELALEAVKLGAQDCIFRETLDKSRFLPTIQYAIERRKISTDLSNLHTKQISATIEAVSDAILIASAQKKVLFANKAAEQMFWKSSKDLIGKKIPVPTHPGRKIEHRLKNTEGDELAVEITTSIVPWEDGEAGFCVTIHDVTKHAKIQAELKSTSRLKDEFIAHLSHELRTPMNGIIGMTSLLLEHQLPEEIRTYVNTVRQSGETMLDIINDLLDLSKIEAGKVELEKNKFSLRTLIDETLDLFSDQVRRKGVLLTSLVSPDIPEEVVADDSRVRQVVANLVSNAVKFTDKGSVVVQASYIDGNRIQVSVKDTGIGIPVKKQPLLFNPFTQLSSDPKRNVQGTGLGLAISKKLTELLGGEISCKSSGKRGAEFKFSFVIEESNAALMRSNVGQKQSVAVFAKDTDFVHFISKNLENYGYEVKRFRKSKEIDLQTELVLIDNEDLENQQKWLSLVSSIKKHARVPIILIGRKESDKPLLNKLNVSSISKYPVKVSELVCFIEEVLSSKSGNFVKDERERQERINHSFENLKLKGKRVLVAEDNMINQRVAASMLEQLGIEADCVSNGKEAIEAAQNYEYDAILMDCRMPIVDGYEAAKVIRNLSKHYHSCPILAVTANALKNERYKSDDALMDMHIPKPITIDVIKQSLEKSLGAGEVKIEPKDYENDYKPIESSTEVLKTSVLDSIQRVSEKVGNNLLEDVISMFFENSPQLIKEIRSAILNDRNDLVSTLAHKLKGSARNLGAVQMANACSQLEVLSENKKLDSSDDVVKKIEEDFQEVKYLLGQRYELKKMKNSFGQVIA